MTKLSEDFTVRIIDNSKSKWWDVGRETKRGTDNYLEDTLERELYEIQEYRDNKRQLYFFSNSPRGTIDGRAKSLGVEEKVNELDLRNSLIDGAIHRGFVWVFGNPQKFTSPPESISVYVVKKNSKKIKTEVVDIYFPIILCLSKYSINILFVNSTNGDCWKYTPNSENCIPAWLAEKNSSVKWDLEIDRTNNNNIKAINYLKSYDYSGINNQPKMQIPTMGSTGIFYELSIDSKCKAAVMYYGNEWRLIELGLILRTMGYDAVKVIYDRKLHKNKRDREKIKMPSGKGVEKRIYDTLLSKFSIVADWRVNIKSG